MVIIEWLDWFGYSSIGAILIGAITVLLYKKYGARRLS